MATQENSKTLTKTTEDTRIDKDADVEMVDDLHLLDQDRTLDVIQEDANMEDRTIHSGDTVRHGNVPDTRSTRLSINLFVPPSDDRPDKVLIEACKKWYAKMLDEDKTCKLIPWFDEDSKGENITSYKDIPNSLFKLKKYFRSTRPKVEGGRIYMEVYLMHTRSITEIKEDLEWWLKKKRIIYTSKQYKLQIPPD